jgi:methyltransferase (TIGR00027 family)
MKKNEASRTAEFNALFRAMETSRKPQEKRLFNDPLAHGFLGNLKWAYFMSRFPFIGKIVPMYIDRNWPGVRPSAIGRTCWIDDQITSELKKGIRQVVILGAGYDSRAYRIPGMEKVRVFELDHPNTLNFKIKGVKDLLGSLPGHVSFVAVDFHSQDFALLLQKSGFDRSIPAFFLMEGVMHYLTAEAVEHTLRSIASLSAPASRLAFTYIHRGLLDGTDDFGGLGRVPATLKESSETWSFGLHPKEIKDFLLVRGFDLVNDIGSVEYRAHYMGDSGSHLKGFEFYRSALVEVKSQADRVP